ncbi:MAG: hypothetical protein KDB26_09420 [Microthrixaceae bacterium]|nr:hypothetical protein [Microthrixaceae bacterium]
MRFKYVAAAAVSVAVLSGCSATTGGSPQPGRVDTSSTATRSETTTTTAEAARTPVTIEGDTGDSLDQLAQTTLDSLVTFWDGQGKVTEPLTYRYWESGKGETSPVCAKHTHRGGMFCNRKSGAKKDDELDWDKTYLGTVVDDPKVGAKAAPVLILAHEYGHAVQAATGHYKDNPNRELQADCLAGVFGKNTVPEVTDSEWAAATFVVYRAMSDGLDMDKITDRTKAFTTGRYGSFDTCMRYTG